MKALLLTNEFPPHIYGGAGVHVDYLSRELAKLIDVDVRCFGDQRVETGPLRVHGFARNDALFAPTDPRLRGALDAFERGLQFTALPVDADVVHCHTWYSHFGGVLAKLGYGKPLVVTTHSLEPSRPWKREQLDRGYDLSCWVEKTALEMADAVIVVSDGMRRDVERLFEVDPKRIHIVHNGIDTEEYRPVDTQATLEEYGIDPGRPYVLFVGRITRQKGIVHLVRAFQHLRPEAQLVLCAGAPDTREIADEMTRAVEEARRVRPGLVWIEEMLPKPKVIELYTHAAVFCCPSIYEPFGIINLEAMACRTAVVASAVGGIKEVVVPEETGLLVSFEQEASGEPTEPEGFARALAEATNRLLDDPALCARMGAAGRVRVERHFGWPAIARKVVDVYRSVGA